MLMLMGLRTLGVSYPVWEPGLADGWRNGPKIIEGGSAGPEDTDRIHA